MTVKVAVPADSFTLTSLITIDGCASLSLMVPVAVTPSIMTVAVSLGSLNASSTVGAVIVKVVTPAGTTSLPLTNVTPLLKVGAPLKSAAVAVPVGLNAKA